MRTRTIITLALTYALLGLLMNSVGIVILQSIAHFGATKVMGSTLEACKDLSVVAASFLLVGAVPAFGYRRALIAVLFLMACTCLLASFATDFAAMQALFVMTGVSFGITKIATYSSIGLLARDPADHASITGLVEGVFMGGVLAGAWLFGWFIDEGDWLRVYWLLSALCVLTSLGWLGIQLDEGAASIEGAGPSATAGWKEMAALAALPATVVALATLFLYVLIEQGVGTWLPTFNREILHLPAAMSVQMSSLFVASLALGRLASGLVLRRVAWLPLLLACLIALALLVIAALPLAEGVQPRVGVGWTNAPFAAYLFPLIGLFLAPIYPTICSVVLSALPRHRHAAMIGLIVIFSALGGTIGSFLVGLLFQSLPGTAAFYFLLVPMGLVALALPVVRRRIESAAA
ncbi:MFS transporter [Sphingopyxis sp. JAI128]|uniref:MFS transporter n=1 Tax=Sphingopyxis sp. JAI128 TaxID=2723066 RepID=UPI00185B91DE|nr:MFS transporter [Sphingopyxis sp. JAI128]MBB6425324.1 fucose permease [Sphingopyxis sp. JAI128]